MRNPNEKPALPPRPAEAKSRLREDAASVLLVKAAPPALFAAFLWATSSNDIAIEAGVAAVLLTIIPWWSYRSWRSRHASGIPLFPILSGAYWLYFAFPLFWGRPLIQLYQFLEVSLTKASLGNAVLMAIAGLALLWLGMRTRIGRRLVPNRVVDVRPDPRGRTYVRLLLALGIILSVFESSPYVLGGGFRQLLLTVTNLMPLVTFAYLLREVVHGRAQQMDKVLVGVYLSVRILVGIASGWLGSLAVLIVIVGVIFFEERKRAPVLAVLLVFATFLFFQAGKTEFRRTYWRDNVSAGIMNRVLFWLESSFEAWNKILEDPSGVALRESVYTSFERVSLLTQTANVLELTPRIVPHQGVQLYRYLAVTWIPRFIWPDKPSVSDANQLYQVAYGMTTEENLENTSIAVGVLTESFIAFGWPGVVAIMLLMGVFYDFAETAFLSRQSGDLFRAIGVVLIFHFIGIEGQMAQYVGGLVQQIAIILAVMLPVARVTTRSPVASRRRAPWQTVRHAPSSS